MERSTDHTPIAHQDLTSEARFLGTHACLNPVIEFAPDQTCTEPTMTLAICHPLVHPTETSRVAEPPSDGPDLGELHNRLGPDRHTPQELATVFRHSGWAPIRRLVYDALRRTETTASVLDNFASCGDGAYVLKSDSDPPRYRIAGSTCHHRLCTPCATERSRVVAQNVIDHIGNKRVRFLTFTLRHTTEPLAVLLDRLYKAFAFLKRTKLWRRNVTGGVAFLEIKRTAYGECWHPHFHVLTEGNYIEKRALQDAWLFSTGDSFVVDIRLPHSNVTVAREVTKYASKPLSTTFVHDPEALDEALLAVKGRRLCSTFGTWRGVLLVKTVDEGGWENLGPLSTWISNAAYGDIEAHRVLDEIDADRTAVLMHLAPIIHPRPPPEQITPRDVQCQLFDTTPRWWDPIS